MTADELAALAEELGLDVFGAAAPAPYNETERHIRERRERGLFADLRFTMAQPEVSCHPELLLDGARTVVSAALCYYADAPEPEPGEGRLPRYAWRDHYADLRERLDALGRRLGGRYRVLVDANHHVDRAGAARSGVGFYGKNTMLITRTHGSWVVLGTLVTDVEIEPTPALELDCGSCRLCIDACPTGALDEPACSTRAAASRTGRRRRHPCRTPVPGRARGAGLRVRHLPGRVPVEPRRREAARRRRTPRRTRSPTVSLVDWLSATATSSSTELDRLYVPKNDPRWLRRNALVALGNVGRPEDAAHAEPFVGADDEMSRGDGGVGARAPRGAAR